MTDHVEIIHLTTNGKNIDNEDINKTHVKTNPSDLFTAFTEKKPIFIDFYANWCGHCHDIDKPWKELIADVKSKYADKNVAIVSVESKIMNADINKIVSGAKGLVKVDGFPTIGLIQNKKFTSYNGERKKDAMLAYLEDNVINKNKKMKGGKKTITKRRKTTKRHTKRRKTTKRHTKRRRT